MSASHGRNNGGRWSERGTDQLDFERTEVTGKVCPKRQGITLKTSEVYRSNIETLLNVDIPIIASKVEWSWGRVQELVNTIEREIDLQAER